MTAAIDITPEQRKTLLEFLRRYIPGVAVWAYGSRVKWTARPNSDLDLVAFTKPEQRYLISELKEAINESNIPFLVDLHIWDGVPECFHEIIRKEYVVLQEVGEKRLSGAGIEGEWETVPLVSLYDFGSGLSKPREEFGFGHGFLSFKDVFHNYFVPATLSQLVNSTEKEQQACSIVRGDVFLTRTSETMDELGMSCVALKNYEGATFNGFTKRLRPKATSKIVPEYAGYYFRSPKFRRDVTAMSSLSTRASLNNEMLARLTIDLPPVEVQAAIGSILKALDDKIELNRRMNATLEAMARALFQSWFVDFDPVRAKLDGREPGGLDAATAALFPEHFQDSEAGHIPKGWTIKPVGEVVDCVGGGTPSTAEPKYWEGGTHHWTTPKDFSSLQAPVLLDTDRKLTDAGIGKISSGLLPAGTLLLSSRAPVGYLAIAAMPVAINQGFIAMKCNERASNFFMLNWCQTNMAEIESRATGTTFAEISKQNFRPIRVVLPPKELMTAFTAKVAPLYAQITANLHQSRTLATLRDTLLPRLLSGELSAAVARNETGVTA